jgi:hypothetical protein
VVGLSADPSTARPPNSITVPEGERRITFPVQTFPVTAVRETSPTAIATIGSTVYVWTGKLTLDP